MTKLRSAIVVSMVIGLLPNGAMAQDRPDENELRGWPHGWRSFPV